MIVSDSPILAVSDLCADVSPAAVDGVKLVAEQHRVGLRRLADDVTSAAVQATNRRLHVANRTFHFL